MAADITTKQSSFAGRYCDAVSSLIMAIDHLVQLKAEYDGNGYAPDGTSPYKLTDAVVQARAPHVTAAQINQAVAGIQAIQGIIATNRGYLEALRS